MTFQAILTLSSPVLLDQRATLDGLVGWCAVEKQRQTSDIVNYDVVLGDLPISKNNFSDGSYIYRASSWFLDESAAVSHFEMYVNKRFPMNRAGEFINNISKNINTSAGEFKNYRIPFFPMSTKQLNFLFEGDEKSVGDLLRTWLKSVGKKASIGYGKIKSIDIEKSSLDPVLYPDAEVRRPVPADDAAALGVKKGMERLVVHTYMPPYALYHPERQKVCVVPDPVRQKGGSLCRS